MKHTVILKGSGFCEVDSRFKFCCWSSDLLHFQWVVTFANSCLTYILLYVSVYGTTVLELDGYP
jgi:hypothetical protein